MAARLTLSAFACGWVSQSSTTRPSPVLLFLALGNGAFVAYWLVRIAAVTS